MLFRFGSHEDHIGRTRRIVDVSQLVLLRSPKVHHIVIAFRGQQLTVHRRRSNYSDFSRVTDYLLYFKVWMLFGCVVVEQRLQVVNEVVLVVWDFDVGHHDVVGSVRPIVVNGAVYPISLAGEVESLQDELAVLLEEWAPLEGRHRPIEHVLINKIVVGMIILSPLYHCVGLASFHVCAGILILISLSI